jgi:hypothetical protein
MMDGPWSDSEEKHEPVSDIDAAMVVDSLKVLDPKRPIREADVTGLADDVGSWGAKRTSPLRLSDARLQCDEVNLRTGRTRRVEAELMPGYRGACSLLA